MKTMSQEAMEAFLNYSWPRNASELINVIERFVIMVPDDEIKDSHLSLLVESRESQPVPKHDTTRSLIQASRQFEKEYIHKTLIKHKWDLKKAASDLKINRDDLRKKIKKLGITFFG